MFSKLSAERLSYIEQRLKEAQPVRINADFTPVSYYYDMVLWATYFGRVHDRTKKILKRATKKTLYAAAAAIYACVLLIGFLGRASRRFKRSVIVAIGTTGFSEISFEVIVVIAFQLRVMKKEIKPSRAIPTTRQVRDLTQERRFVSMFALHLPGQLAVRRKYPTTLRLTQYTMLSAESTRH